MPRAPACCPFPAWGEAFPAGVNYPQGTGTGQPSLPCQAPAGTLAAMPACAGGQGEAASGEALPAQALPGEAAGRLNSNGPFLPARLANKPVEKQIRLSHRFPLPLFK